MGIAGSSAGVVGATDTLALTTTRMIEKYPIRLKGGVRKVIKYLGDNALPYPGGRLLEVPVLYSLGVGGVQWITGDQNIVVLPQKGFGSTMWSWKLGLAVTSYTLEYPSVSNHSRSIVP